MYIVDLLKDKKMTKYRLSKESGVPYATLNDICNGKTSLRKCNGETLYNIAKVLDISIEELIESELDKRIDFELFKSNVCHNLKRLGDIDFLIDVLKSDEIRSYYQKKWYVECFYLLAMVDYISNENDIPLCEEYNDLRQLKLDKMVYPAGIVAMSYVSKSDDVKNLALKEAIPEFLKYNIVESEIRNVI